LRCQTKQMLIQLAQNPNVASVEEDKIRLKICKRRIVNQPRHYVETTGGMRVPAAWDFAQLVRRWCCGM
ncbi:MAG: hypothetical protein U5L01_16445, partial [Rheinheimera sp.]|nr:hypothetical protein [Rheinheimera sp.]